MSRQIVVTYQIELPDDFDKSVAIGMAYQVIHRELGEKLLKEFGVQLAQPKFADEVTRSIWNGFVSEHSVGIGLRQLLQTVQSRCAVRTEVQLDALFASHVYCIPDTGTGQETNTVCRP